MGLLGGLGGVGGLSSPSNSPNVVVGAISCYNALGAGFTVKQYVEDKDSDADLIPPFVLNSIGNVIGVS